jgi:purine-binding chemotaxis protein CheW
MTGEAERLEEVKEDTTKNRYLTFNIDTDEYGIEIAYVKEIIEMAPVTHVPRQMDYAEGIINLRGDIIGVLNVRKRFLKAVKPYDEHTCIVVIEYADFSLGLIVDNVNEVINIEETAVSAPPNAKLNHYNQYIRNIGRVNDNVILLLDLDKFLQQEQ